MFLYNRLPDKLFSWIHLECHVIIKWYNFCSYLALRISQQKEVTRIFGVFVMWKSEYQRNNKGFTFTELLVTIGIIGTLAGIGTVAVSKVRGTNQQTTCVNNLRGISQGLQMYYNDYMAFPEDGYPDDANDLFPLSTDLANYISIKSTFVCPVDNDPTSTNNFASYDPYYVSRKGSYQSEELAIGCPRHRGAKNSTSLFSTGSTEVTRIGAVLANGQEIPPDGTTAQRTISNNGDVMTFDDGSTVTITQANPGGGGYGCIPCAISSTL
ncbi:MAG: hypothetical protein SCARUB_04062 [Candidatus Scalindua rubra]|uniref:Type II secretion system protein n=1 Tax=Candidatus Scalindua rubra TaxID=1872076 RepID=A0A1E3X5C4_9BACT|nr:MAG: hypothetical protein SCARUB_04062 [Candidatus Scalindua rubra]